MATTVRIDDQTRVWLERIRAELTLATGERLSLEETLHVLTERVLERKDVLLPELLPDTPPQLSDEAWERIFALPKRRGATIRVEDMDEIAAEDTR